MLPEQNLPSFVEILHTLMYGSGEAVKAAEIAYCGMSVDDRVANLITVLKNEATASSLSEQSAVLLGNLIKDNFVGIEQIPTEALNQMKSALLELLRKYTSLSDGVSRFTNSARQVCNAVLKLLSKMNKELSRIEWPEMVDFVFGSSLEHLPAALYILREMPVICHGVRKAKVRRPLIVGFNTNDELLKYESAKTFGTFMASEIDCFGADARLRNDCLIAFLEEFFRNLESSCADSDLMFLVAEIIATETETLNAFLPAIFIRCLEVFKKDESVDVNVSAGAVNAALETMLMICCYSSEILMAQNSGKIEEFLQCLFDKLLNKTRYDIDWFTSAAEDGDESERFDDGQKLYEALEDVTDSLGIGVMLVYVRSLLMNVLNDVNWQHRYVAIVASACVVSHADVPGQMLDDTVRHILMKLKAEEDDRIHYACARALEMLSISQNSEMIVEHCDEILPSLSLLCHGTKNSRVQLQSLSALNAYLEVVPSGIVSYYAGNVMHHLRVILNDTAIVYQLAGDSAALHRAICLLNALVKKCDGSFAQFYEDSAIGLQNILTGKDLNAHKSMAMRLSALECLTHIACAMGEPKGQQVIAIVMEIFLSDFLAIAEIDDTVEMILVNASKVLGPDFDLHTRSIFDYIAAQAVIEMNTDECAGQQQHIHCERIAAKNRACRLLCALAYNMETGFLPYLERFYKIIMANFKWACGIEDPGIECLLRCAQANGIRCLQDMWHQILSAIIELLAPDFNMTSETFDALQSLVNCINFIAGLGDWNQLLTHAVVAAIMSAVKTYLEVYTSNRIALMHDSSLEFEVQFEPILCAIGDLIERLFRILNAEFLPFFDGIMPILNWFGVQTELLELELFVDCMNAYLIFCVPSASDVLENYLTAIQNMLLLDNRSATAFAAYGVIAEFCGVALSDRMPYLCHQLTSAVMISCEKAPCSDATAALAKMLKFQAAAFSNGNDTLDFWFSTLPITNSRSLAAVAYDFLCDLIEADNPVLLGDAFQNVPRVFKVAAEAFVHETLKLDSVTGRRLLGIMQKMCKVKPECRGLLQPAKRAIVEKGLNSL